MKTPDRIYLQEPTKWFRTEKTYDNDMEYIRTDAFIEKACLILKDISCQSEIIEQFKKRIR